MKIKTFIGYSAALVALVSFTSLLAVDDSKDNFSGFTYFNNYPDQEDFPVILLQPVNQMVHTYSDATFSVVAANGPLAYQWLRNGIAIPSATNSTLTIANAGIEDVGLYSCNVSKDLEIVPTRAAQLMVYVNSTDSDVDIDQVKELTTFATTSTGGASMASGAGSVTVWATPVTSSGTNGTCPGAYIGYVNYTKTVAQGWGWAPSTNTTIHTATDINRVDTKVQYSGKRLDSGCDQTTVAVPDPTYSTKYRFTIYFTNNVPTNSYSITLDGFDP